MTLRRIHLSRFFRAADSGVAAVEFAIVMPVLVMFMLGGVEISRYIYIVRSISNLSYSLATRVAERTTPWNFNDAVFDYFSTVVTSPFLLNDAAARGVAWNYDIALTTSSIIFTPTQTGCTSNCAYTGKVAWSVNSPIAGQRSCTTPPLAVSDTAAPSLSTLPTDVFSAGSIIVADVVYNYTPVFGATFIPSFTIRRSYYMQPRYQFPIPYAGNEYSYVCN